MPGYLILLGVLALVVVAMGLVSVLTGSWYWSAATATSILLWLALAAVVPKWAHRLEDAPRHRD
jgi:membrane protein implicated in regulation of membrane protease activity